MKKVANSIVFQNSAQQLKTAVYGYYSTTNSYLPLKVNSSGELYVIPGTLGTIGTLKYVDQIGTLKYVDQIVSFNIDCRNSNNKRQP